MALGRHKWPEAFEQLTAADRDGQLSGADLESLALAAFFAAQADVALEVKERAFKAHLAEGNDVRAAYLAIDVARTYGFQGKTSIAAAWGRRAAGIIGAQIYLSSHGPEIYKRENEPVPVLFNHAPTPATDGVVRSVMQASVLFRNAVTP